MNRTRVPDPSEAAELADSGAAGDPIQMTRALVAVPSVNPDLGGPEGTEGEDRVARLCARWLREWGCPVEFREVTPGRPNVVARLRGRRDGPTLLLNGHTDTVGVDGMTIPPFDPDLRDGKLWGRGSCDMKGGLAAILAVARHFAAQEADFPGELVVALTPDEEYGSIGMDALLAEGLTAEAAIVTEPTSLAIMPANRGFQVVRVLVRGVMAHGSRPDLGRDAIRGAGRILDALDLFEEDAARDPSHPLLGASTIHAGTIRGGTAVSVYPDRCELTLEARTLPGFGADSVMERFGLVLGEARRRDPELDVEVEEVLFRPGTELEPDAPLVLALSDALRAEGEEVRIEGMSAWVESALLNEAGIPALCFGPGAIEKAHTVDEFVPVDEVERVARVLLRFTLEFLEGGTGAAGRTSG
jgi:acetylornithine deacetylase